MNGQGTEQVRLSEIPSDFAGGTNELSAPEKAQFKMTYWVLGGAAIILLVSGGAYVFAENGIVEYADDIRALCSQQKVTQLIEFCNKHLKEVYSHKNLAAKDVFEFCENFIPPIVTLVLGAHYVTKNSDQNS